MVNVYLSGQDARNAAADLWQQDQLRRLNEQFAPPPAESAPQPDTSLSAPPTTPALPSTSPTAPSTMATGATPTSPAATSFAAPSAITPNPTPDRNDIADQFTRNAVADAWETHAISQVMAGVSQAGQGVQSALADIPQEARGLVSNYTALPGAQPAQPAAVAPGAISGISPTAPVTAPLSNPASTQQPIGVTPATQTTVGLSGGYSDPRLTGPALSTLGLIGSTAQQYALGPEGARAAQAVGLTEGALVPRDDRKDIGDNGNSFGWAQLYRGGQLQNFAADMGMPQDQAGEYARQHPDIVAQWALSPTGTNSWRNNGYLGNAIRAGLKAGLTGPDLATFAQAHGQVSVSPERAGQNWQSLFGSGQTAIAQAPSADQTAASVGQPTSIQRPSQFSMGMSWGDALAFCGPTAAYAFAKAFGRSPTVPEAQQLRDLAVQNGWTPGGGMNGVVNEKKLLDALGVPTKLETNVDWGKITSDVQNGNPVIVSTPGHYFTIDDTKAAQGGDQMLYHVGTSGTDLKAGAEWMTQGQIEKLEGRANGVLYADNPATPQPSIAAAVGGAIRSVAAPVQQKAQDIVSAVSNLAQPAQQTAQGIIGAVGNIGGALGTTASNLSQGIGSAWQQAGQANAANPMIQNMIASSSPSTINPYRDIVQEGIPSIVQGVQQGDVGRVLGGALQTFGGVTSGLPGGEGQIATGAGGAVRSIAENPDVQAALRSRMRGEAEVGFAMGLPTGGPAAAPAAQQSGADLLQAMLEQARARGVNPAELESAQAEINRMRASETGQPSVPPTQPPTAQPPTGAPGPLPPNEYLPTGPQPGQFGMFGQELPYGGSRPSGGEAVGPAGPQPGQLQIGSELPVGGPRPMGTEPLAPGAQPGQMQFGSELPIGGQRPTGTEPPLPAGRQPGQQGLGIGEQFQPDLMAPSAGNFEPPPVGSDDWWRLADLRRYRATATPINPEATGVPATSAMGAQNVLPGFPKPVEQPTALDIINEIHRGNVISGASTATHVVVNTLLSPAWSLATRGTADVLGGVTGQLTGGRVGLETGLSRAGGRGLAVGTALAQSGEAFAQALSEFYRDPGRLFNRVDNPVLAGLLKAQAAPGAALHAALQSVAQGSVSRMELGAIAADQAAREGLSGQAQIARMAELMNNPTPRMLADAQDVGQRAALRGEAGTLQQRMQSIASIPLIGPTLFPVVRIGSQALAQGIEKSPIGAIGTAFDVGRYGLAKAGLAKPGTPTAGPYAQTAADLTGAGLARVGGAVTPLADRVINNVAGTALTMWLIQKAQDGSITGNGPTDPRARATLQSQGWQPHSILTPLGYMDYHVLGPLAIPLAIAGNWHDATYYAKSGAGAGDIAGDLVQRVGSYLADATGLRTIADLYSTIQGDARALPGQFIGNVAAGFVPESGAVRSAVTAFDPNLRRVEPGNIQQVIQQGLPGGTPIIGGRTDLPIRQDVLGRPETNPQVGLGTFLPRMGTGQPDPVLTLLSGAGIELPATAPKEINYSGRQIQLTPDEQQQRQTLFGQRLQQTMQGYLKSANFQRLPPDQQFKALEPVVRAASQYADQRVIAEMPAADRRARMASAPRAYGAGVVPYVAASGGLASLVARQSAAEADAAHQRLLQSYQAPLVQQGPIVQQQPAA